MTTLEQVTQMKNQQIPEDQIINTLRQKGVSPKEINDALGQSKIKNAVADINQEEEMQPSISQAPPEPEQPQEEIYSPQIQETQEEMYAPQPQEYSSQEIYQPEYEDYSASSETMIEVAEQVFIEKVKKIQQQTATLTEFKTIAETKIENIGDRLTRIETIIDRLQIEILNKIGSYGDNLENIKKEMTMMQDSFGKVINPLANRASENIQTPKTNTSSRKKSI
ncbi:MAG: hypothetical protein ABIA78_00315 [archaeon]